MLHTILPELPEKNFSSSLAKTSGIVVLSFIVETKDAGLVLHNVIIDLTIIHTCSEFGDVFTQFQAIQQVH